MYILEISNMKTKISSQKYIWTEVEMESFLDLVEDSLSDMREAFK